MEKYPSVEKIKYVGQADSPCIVPTSPSNLNGNESKRSSYRVNRSRTNSKKSADDSPISDNTSTNPKADNGKFNIVGVYLRQFGKSILLDKENTSTGSQGSKNSYSVNSDTDSKSKTSNSSSTTPLRRTKISPTKESPCKSAFTSDTPEANKTTTEDSPKRKQKSKAKELQQPTVSRKNSNKRRNRRRGKSDLGYVESFSLDDSNDSKDEPQEKDNNKEESKEDENSRYIENELLLEASSDSFSDLYDDYYKSKAVERQDSFGSDSAVGTMKSDFFADIDLAKIRDGSSALLQELCRTSDKCPATPNRAASPFESTAL